MTALSAFALAVVNYFHLSEVSVAFAGMIFVFYLALSDKLKKFKIGIVEAELKRSSDTEFNIPDKVDAEVQDTSVEKAGARYLEDVIRPALAQKGAPVLKIVKREDDYYRPSVLKEYLKYFRYVVFVDSNNKFYGYMNALTLSAIITKEEDRHLFDENASQLAPICLAINKWQIAKLVGLKTNRIKKGLSRKDALRRMDSYDTDILPVVDEQERFIGIIERQNIAYQILREIL